MPDTYFVIARAGTGKIGAVGAAEGACVDVGSIRKVTFSTSTEIKTATAHNRNDQVVLRKKGPVSATLTLELEEITTANLARVLGCETDSEGRLYEASGNTDIPEFSGYFEGFEINGEACKLHIVRASADPSGEVTLDGEQQVLTLQCQLMPYDSSTFTMPTSGDAYDTYAFLPDVADTTAPTISSVTPADGATGVAKAATTVVVWAFSEAIRSEDVTAERFFVHDDSGNVKAGTLSVNGAGTEVTFTPGAAWAATTDFHAVVVAGVRDVAGNRLAATSVTQFTTGA